MVVVVWSNGGGVVVVWSDGDGVVVVWPDGDGVVIVLINGVVLHRLIGAALRSIEGRAAGRPEPW